MTINNSDANMAVAFFIFNRPETTLRVFEQIRAARPSTLLLVADGPRPNVAGESERCAAVRAIVSGIDWPCNVCHNFSEINLGNKQRLSSGLDWVFSLVSEAIILEDDCLPHPAFFQFCRELLERYRNDERIALIRGDNWPLVDAGWSESYRFSKYPSTWGWASWRRVWQNYDVEMSGWQGASELVWLTELLGSATMAHYWKRMYELILAGKLDTWDLQLVYSCWRAGQLSIVPGNNLISNIGWGEGATHTSNPEHVRLGRPVFPMPAELIHPGVMTSDSDFDLIGALRLARIERFGHQLWSQLTGFIYDRFYG